MLYVKSALLGSTLQGYCDQTGATLLSGDAIPFYRAGDKQFESVEVVGWTIPPGALVEIAADSALDADATPAMALGTNVWVDGNVISYVLDCDYAKFYSYTANVPAGKTFYVQYKITWAESVSGEPSGDLTQVMKIVAQARALPAVTGTGGSPGVDPVYVTDAELAAAVDSGIADHNVDEAAHPSLLAALDAKADVDHVHSEYVAASELGTSIATLVDGTVPLEQLPAGISGTVFSDATPQPLGTASAGVLDTASRGDHAHKAPTPSEIGAALASHAHAQYASLSEIAVQVASHNTASDSHPDIRALAGVALGSASPAALAATAVAGSSAYASHEDHAHPRPLPADIGASAVGHTHGEYVTVASKGQASGVASLGTDAKVPLAQLPAAFTLSSATPLPLGTASAGTAVNAPHADHVHQMPTYSDVGAAAASHTHAYASLGSATPQPLGAAAAGSATAASHENHVHAMPSAADVGAAAASHTHSEYLPTSQKAAASGVAPLDSNSLVPLANIPVSAIIGTANALTYKGVIDCTANPDYPAADAGDLYIVSAPGKIGGASGLAVAVGNQLLCKTDSTPSGSQAAVGSEWNLVAVSSGGGVTGPASSAYNSAARWDSLTGAAVKGSNLVVGDLGNITIAGLNTTTVTDVLVNPSSKTGGNLFDFQNNGVSQAALSYLGVLTLGTGVDKMLDSRTAAGRALWHGTLADYVALSTKSSSTMYVFSDAATAFQTAAGMSSYYTKTEADAAFQPLGSYLDAATAASTYETQSHAESTYETQAHAAATWQPKASVRWSATLACGDMFSDMEVSSRVAYFRVAGAKTLSEIRASLASAASGSAVEVDVLVNGASVLETPIAIDAGELTSKTAAVPAVLAFSALADDDEVSVSVTRIGSGSAGKGLMVTLIGVDSLA